MLRPRTCLCVLCGIVGLALAYLLLFAAPNPAAAQEAAATKAAAPVGPVSFIKDVAPILKENCFACHGVKNPKAKFDMTHYEAFMAGAAIGDQNDPTKTDQAYILP